MLRVRPASRLPRAPAWMLVLYALWGAGVVFVYLGARATGLRADLCPMRLATQRPCPFCGGTRAAFHLASLEPLQALSMNPLVALALPALAGVLALRFATARTIVLEGLPSRRRAAARALTLAAGAALLANWAYLLAFPPGAAA